MWHPDEITDALAAALQHHDAALRQEQSVYGLDALDELDLHAIIAGRLATITPWGVLREQPYPHEWRRKVRTSSDLKSEVSNLKSDALPIPRDRMRCDLVLTPKPHQTLDDSLHNEKQRRAEEAELQGTLFESLSTSHLAPGATGPILPPSPLRLPPSEAFWLELKTLGQYTNKSNLPGPNRTYSSELTRNPIADLTKLTADERIHHAAAAVILFSLDEPTARHDLDILMQRARAKDLPITLSSPHIRTFPISDRIGNTMCVVCLIAIRKG
jgi:hypothetical protein